MSWKSSFPSGIVLNSEHDGLLTVAEDRLLSIIKKEPISNVYHVEQTPFARGKFATVRKCTHQRTGVEYAAKFIRKRRRAMDQRQDIVHEVAVLQLAADCHCIVSLHEVYETASEVALVLELASGGELQSVLDVQDGLQEAEAIEMMRQIIEALSFLHDRNIAHLDLKPQNILLTGSYPGSDIKLCDFGISRVIQGGVEVREILGTPDYVAPEILSYEPISLATDIWSVGVLAYVLLSGFSPFGGDTKQETFLNISQCSLTFPPELFDGVSNQARDFIRATLQVEPKKRLTSRQCLQHPWLTPSLTLITHNVTVESVAEVHGCQSVVAVIEEAEVLSPSSENGVSAVVNVQEAPCTQTAEVADKVRVLNGFGKTEFCRTGEDITLGCFKGSVIKEEISYKSYSHSYTYKEEITMEDVMCPERTSVGDRINGLKISTVSLECASQGPNENSISEYKERRIAVEMSQEQDFPGDRTESPESDEDLPVHKRPKNCKDDCGFPQCCHLPLTPVENICHNGVAGAAVERPLIC